MAVFECKRNAKKSVRNTSNQNPLTSYLLCGYILDWKKKTSFTEEKNAILEGPGGKNDKSYRQFSLVIAGMDTSKYGETPRDT